MCVIDMRWLDDWVGQSSNAWFMMLSTTTIAWREDRLNDATNWMLCVYAFNIDTSTNRRFDVIYDEIRSTRSVDDDDDAMRRANIITDGNMIAAVSNTLCEMRSTHGIDVETSQWWCIDRDEHRFRRSRCIAACCWSTSSVHVVDCNRDILYDVTVLMR